MKKLLLLLLTGGFALQSHASSKILPFLAGISCVYIKRAYDSYQSFIQFNNEMIALEKLLKPIKEAFEKKQNPFSLTLDRKTIELIDQKITFFDLPRRSDGYTEKLISQFGDFYVLLSSKEEHNRNCDINVALDLYLPCYLLAACCTNLETIYQEHLSAPDSTAHSLSKEAKKVLRKDIETLYSLQKLAHSKESAQQHFYNRILKRTVGVGFDDVLSKAHQLTHKLELIAAYARS